jgi:serine/threonine-protein phosphatase 6 regulatory subunit 3
VLVKANYHVLDTALIEYRVISRCMDLFFQYKWNNVLHTLLEQLVTSLLELKPSYLSLYLLRDCHLVDRILQAQQNEEQEKSMRTPDEQYMPHQGYMGHLYVMANAVVASSKKHSAIYYLLEDVPNKAWKKFVEGKLKQVCLNVKLL